MKALNGVTSAVRIKLLLREVMFSFFFSSTKYGTVKTGQYLIAEGYILSL